VAGSIGDPGTVNRYVYVGDDPVNNVDPSGQLGISSVGRCFTNFITCADNIKVAISPIVVAGLTTQRRLTAA
jgi:hypothetical protein